VQIVLHAQVPRRSAFKKANLSRAQVDEKEEEEAARVSPERCPITPYDVVLLLPRSSCFVFCSDPGRVYVLMATYIM
jgi:hypothetical protein